MTQKLRVEENCNFATKTADRGKFIMDYLHLRTSMHLFTLLFNHYYCSLHCLHCTVIHYSAIRLSS